MDPFLGQLMCVSFNFAPKGWALCNGQLLPINQNQALFSLLGTTFGGNGQTTFALPDLRGRAAMSSGAGSGLSNYILGQVLGTESVTLNNAQLPAHSHNFNGTSSAASVTAPGGNVLASAGQYVSSPPDPAASSFDPATVSSTGGAIQPHENRSPSMTMNWIIALVGIFPSRN